MAGMPHGPSWATWEYTKNNLPAEFFSHDVESPHSLWGFLKWLSLKPWVGRGTPIKSVLHHVLLAIGMACRDLNIVAFTEEGVPNDYPDHMNQCAWSMAQVEQVEKFLPEMLVWLEEKCVS
jgi:hypothetical protein